MNLFSKYNEVIKLPLQDADVTYYPNFITPQLASAYFNTILEETNWREDDIKIFGKTYKQPRLTALFGDSDKPYTYSNITMHPKPFSKTLSTIKAKVQALTGHKFTTCLANLYRDGNDSNGWHADDEKELGKNSVIASVSLGATRNFQLKHKSDPSIKYKLDLISGSLLLMRGTTQEFYKHQIPKTKKEVNPRINLTFRYII